MPFCIMLLLLVGAAVLPAPVRCLADPRVPDIFFPFGSDQGDVVAAPGDDLYDVISITSLLRVCNSVYTRLWVCTNGVVSFNRAVAEYSAVTFPIPGLSMLAAYWADANTLINNGRIYYRQTNDYGLATRASRAITAAITGQNVWPFNANWLLIATWHNVTYYGGSTTTPIHSFQVIIASDGVYSFAIVNYGNMTWTHGTYSDVPAQVGFNCMDGLNFYTVPWSRTENVVYIGSQTNVATKGRWIFRLDGTNGANICTVPTMSASLPSLSCPTLSGPTVINRLWFEFYCTVNTTVTDSRARFDVTFYSDGVAIYTATATSTDRRVTLHERYLQGRLGKVLYCSAVSYWSDSTTERSPEVRSINFYTPGIEAIVYPMGVTESDSLPVTVVVKSTIPITCQQLDNKGQPMNCIMNFTIRVSSDDIAVRQRYPGSTSKACTFSIAEADWKPTESRAYNRDAPLELRAKIDLYVTAPRPNQIVLAAPLLSMKNINGSSYINPWMDYTAAVGQVFKYDSPSPLGLCSSVTDPHLRTFDGVGYTTLTTGQYIYARSISGLAFEVQVRHWQCPQLRPGVSCVCGVAIREESAILAADMCNDGIMHYITYDAKNLPNGAGITTTNNGASFKILMPSGSKIIGNIHYFGLNINLYVPEKIRTSGLCGSFDRNPFNDLTYRDSNRVATLQLGQASVDFVESWRVFSNASLFEGHLSEIPGADPGTYTPSTFCSCELEKDKVCGGFAVTDNSSWKWEPKFVVKPKEPLANVNGRVKRAADQTIRTDDTDYTYIPTFNQSSTVQNTGQWPWPTPSGINESQALSICKGRIVNSTVIGSSCFTSLASANATSQLVQTCVADIGLTDNIQLSADSKVSQIQQSCIVDLVSRNRSDITNTSVVIAQVTNVLPTVTAYRCDPFDCSGHGTCVNGSCNCTGDYVGSDCAVSRSAVPYISLLLDPSVCDIRTRLCQSVVMVTVNRTSNVSCKVVVAKLDGSNTTYFTSAQVRSPQTTACSLPLEPLDLYNVNFTALNASDFYRLKYGGAVLSYTVLISNNGRNYSAGQPMKVVDSMCMDCTGNTSCTLKPNTCRINGYCFAKFDRNPYDASWLCLPEVSTDRWVTAISSTPGPPSTSTTTTPTTTKTTTTTPTTTRTTTTTPTTTKTTTTTPTTTRTTTTTPTTTKTTTTTPTTTRTTTTTPTTTKTTTTTPTTTRTTTTTPTTTKTTTTTPTTTRTTTTTPTTTKTTTTTPTTTRTTTLMTTRRSTAMPTTTPCVTWTSKPYYVPSLGAAYPSIATLDECQALCLLDLDCQFIEFDPLPTSGRCRTSAVPYADPGSQFAIPTIGAAMYVLNRQCVTCVGARWTIYLDENSFYGIQKANLSSLVACLRGCIADVSCAAVDFTPGAASSDRCWFHTPTNGFELTRGEWTGTTQYVARDKCMAVTTTTTTTTTTRPVTTRRITPATVR